MDQEELYIFPLSTKDFILGEPLYDCMAAKLDVLPRTITFGFKNCSNNILTIDRDDTLQSLLHASLKKKRKSLDFFQ